ncbi:MAG: MFS transporter, partial [Gammaproteobacteria bacterium]|nr:MFS transporter [Gammaproteobacteria bacterium]
DLAYVFVALFYVASAGLSIGIAVVGQARPERLASPMADLRAGVAYVARSARIHVLLWIAFLVNLAGLCVTGGLLPVVARDVYGMDELGLGMLVATFAAGALVGSLGIATVLRRLSADPVILYSLVIWHLVLFGFAFIETPTWGIPVLGLIGLLSSLVMVPLASALIFATDVEYRARVLGLRQLAVVGLPIGLLITGTLVDVYSVAVALASVALAGVGAGVWLLLRWAHLVGAQSERS